MINSSDIKQQISQTKMGNLKKDLDKFIEKERQAIAQNTLNLIQQACLEESGYNKDNLRELFKSSAKLEPQDTDKTLLTTWQNTSLNLEEKAQYLANYIAKISSIPSENFVTYMNNFFKIIKTEEELNLFLKNPQAYIDGKKNLSVYQLHMLQLVINNPVFNNFPSINRTTTNTFISTPVTTQMYNLHLTEYASTDATRFPQCINPEVKEEILKKSQKQYHGPQVIGAGALPSYDRGSIAQTAKSVKQMKMGACHNFAQLAADHFLSLMESGKIMNIPVKMVSHKAALGSHTFLLFNHKIDDLNDLSDCLIVDPWAVAMGHNYTYGVFTMENYPFPDMTTNLECCFDTQKPTISQQSSAGREQSLNQELTRVLAREGLFAARSTPQEATLSRTQRIAVMFLTQMAKYAEDELHNTTRKEFINMLIEEVKNGHTSPRQGIKTAVIAISARIFEKIDDDNYSWKGTKALDKSILPAFNETGALKFWSNHLGSENKITAIDTNILEKIVTSLDNKGEHTFTRGSTLNMNNK